MRCNGITFKSKSCHAFRKNFISEYPIYAGNRLYQGSPNYGPRAKSGPQSISSGPRSRFVNDEKIIYTTYGKFFDFVEYNISHNNHIA